MASPPPSFDPNGPELVYVLIADHMAKRIDSGEFQPGRRLPPERDLAVEYGVAYQTMRRAMRELRDRNLVKTVYGKGNFVI